MVSVRIWIRIRVRVRATLVPMQMLPFIKRSITQCIAVSFQRGTSHARMLCHITTFICLKTRVQFSLNFDINFDKYIIVAFIQ